MASFQKNAFATPFGKNVFLRSTQDVKSISGTVAKDSVPFVTIDGYPNQKVLQTGVVMAKIIGGLNDQKLGPFQSGASGTDEIQTITPSGTWSGGTFDITVSGAKAVALAYNSTAAVIQAALKAAGIAQNIPSWSGNGVVVTGGPLSSGVLTITFTSEYGIDQPTSIIDVTLVTGTTPAAVVATPTQGVAGATDGRNTLANIVGINNTFLPWQLVDRDVDCAIIVQASVVQANCFEQSVAGLYVPVSNTTAAAMVAQKSININWF